MVFHQAEASGTLNTNIKGSVYAALLFIESRPVCRVLHALYSAPQPNWQVKGTLASPSVLPTPNWRPLPL